MARVANSKLLQTGKGIRQLTDAFVVIVKTEWNAAVVDELEKGCLAALKKQKIKNTLTLTVPGPGERPFAIKSLWDKAGKKSKPEPFIARGCVIKG
ncbi:MAG TPA: 6,7-dimethyl-8-ribityllumazine synthase, partial [Chitinophagaceae bacterium]|nr:6,7-dimethyl-8-ribityllumazine synthase [Chitinophagaceae bacterium]